AASALAAAAPPMPRPTVLVENGEIRLGDLFANLPSGGERVVAIAPPPGERLILDAAQLTAIAAAAGLDWRPRSSRDRILVERSSRIVDAAQIERLFARAIGALAAGREFE